MHFMYGRNNGIATEAQRLYDEAYPNRQILHIVCLEDFTKDCVIPVYWANSAIYPEDMGHLLLEQKK